MVHYIQFETGRRDDNLLILVEVEQQDISSSGPIKAGIKDNLKGVIATAQTTLSEAVKCAVHQNVSIFVDAVESLPDPPTEVEISFGLKMTGEIGNVAIGKTAGEANYTVKLAWKQTPRK